MQTKVTLTMIAALAFLALLLAAAGALAAPVGEARITADGGLRIAAWRAMGPPSIDFLADGTATVYLIDTAVVSGDTLSVVKLFPGDALGDSVYYLRDGIPRTIDTSGDRPDSLYIDVITASEVIVTW